MPSTAASLSSAQTTPAHTLRILLREVRFEVLRAARTRAFSLSSIGFPVMFYILFGLVLNRNQTIFPGVPLAKYLLGGYAVFGALGAAIFGIGVGVSLDRSAGWLDLKQASPMPPLAYVFSKVVMAMVFSVIITCVLTALGLSVGHVQMSIREFVLITLIAAGGAIPFSCLGLAVAFLVPPTSAGGIANMIYLPMSFLSGLWVPLPALPHFLQSIAPVFPTYHLAQMMYGALGAPESGSTWVHVASMIGFALLMAGIAWIGYSRGAENA